MRVKDLKHSRGKFLKSYSSEEVGGCLMRSRFFEKNIEILTGREY